VFEHLRRLEHVQITYAEVPSIGDATFWPGDQLLALDLSHNRISRLQPNSFLNLSRLHTLDLSYNRLKSLPSGAFVFLPNLDRLSLAHNLLTQLAPSAFLNVYNLRKLDLYHNPIGHIDSTDLRGLRSLVELNLADCLLSNLSTDLWPNIETLQTLDLTRNRLTRLPTDAFRRLRHLRVLKLSRNNLSQIAPHSFSGCRLTTLELSHNRLTQLATCIFCNSTVVQLDLSHNQLSKIATDRLQPLSSSLQSFRLAGNSLLGTSQVQSAVRTLTSLKHIDISGCSLDDRFQTADAFKSSAAQLIHLNMSDNALVNLSAPFFAPFVRLQVLDVSSNRLFRMPEQVAHLLARRTHGSNASLQVLRLHHNPFRCFTCHVRPLRDLFRLRPQAYFNACDSQPQLCARCAAPADVADQPLHSLPETRIRFCSDPGVFQRLYASEPRLGLILALVIICSLLVLIVLIVCRYRRQRAVYYTHESKLNAATLFTIQQVADATAFSPSLTSPSDSSPTNSAAHQFHRLPFSRQISSEAASQRDLALSCRRSLDRSVIQRTRPDLFYDTNGTYVDLVDNDDVRPSDSRRQSNLFTQTLAEHSLDVNHTTRPRYSVDNLSRRHSHQEHKERLQSEPMVSAGPSSSAGSSVHSGHSDQRSSGIQAIPLSVIDFRPPISEHLLCANVRTVHTQPIYSQPALSFLSTTTAHPTSLYAQSGLLLDPNTFASNRSDCPYFAPSTTTSINTSTAVVLLNQRESLNGHENTPKMYQI
jgi:Leucine-rich repeat (LRR) protein